MTDLSRWKYCFLETVFKGSKDTIEALEFVLSDVTFRNVEFYCCGLPEAEEFYKGLAASGVSTDFSFAEGFLKCGSTVRETPYNNKVKKNGFIVSRSINSSLYDLLNLGSDFIFVENDVVEKDSYVGGKAKAFSCIRFAKTTMTVYVPMFSDEGMYNKIIIALEDGFLRFRHFLFGVPAEKGAFCFPGCTFVKRMTINNIEYGIYNTEGLQMYDAEESLRLSMPLINKAMCIRERNAAGRFALRELKRSLSQFADVQEKKTVWTGGSGSYKSHYGVTFDNSMPKFGNDEYHFVRSFVMEELACGVPADKVKAEIYQKDWASNFVYAAICILSVVSMASDNVAEDIAAIDSLIALTDRQILAADTYLYRVRANSYVRHIHLAGDNDVRLFGGNESDCTVVMEGFNYEAE